MLQGPNTFQEIYAICPKAIHDIVRNSERNCVKLYGTCVINLACM